MKNMSNLINKVIFAPCYQARDVAVMRGKLTNSTVILRQRHSQLESYYNAQCGKYTLSVLHQRADVASLPNVTYR